MSEYRSWSSNSKHPLKRHLGKMTGWEQCVDASDDGGLS